MREGKAAVKLMSKEAVVVAVVAVAVEARMRRTMIVWAVAVVRRRRT